MEACDAPLVTYQTCLLRAQEQSFQNVLFQATGNWFIQVSLCYPFYASSNDLHDATFVFFPSNRCVAI